jgi:hypothetical protein
MGGFINLLGVYFEFVNVMGGLINLVGVYSSLEISGFTTTLHECLLIVPFPCIF